MFPVNVFSQFDIVMSCSATVFYSLPDVERQACLSFINPHPPTFTNGDVDPINVLFAGKIPP